MAVIAGCGTLPSATPPADAIPDLTSRFERSRADLESVLRLSAGLWAQGEQQAAFNVLEQARAAVPEAAIYTAALGAAYEAVGVYEAARDHYLEFLEATAASDVSDAVARRIDVMRGETAAPLVRRLVETGRPLDHGQDAQLVVALPRIRSADGDPELTRLAAVATELLMVDLRENLFLVLDWELAEAARQELEGAQPPQAVARAVGGLLDARRTLLISAERAPGDSVAFQIDVLRAGTGTSDAFESGVIQTTLAAYPMDRMRLAARVWELLLGSELGSAPDEFFQYGPEASIEAMLASGDGLLAMELGDRARARSSFATSLELAPDFRLPQQRLAQVEDLEAFRGSETLPLADEMVAYARRLSDLGMLVRASDWSLPLAPTRHGIGEAFGLDRLGSQVFVDLLIRADGGGS